MTRLFIFKIIQLQIDFVNITHMQNPLPFDTHQQKHIFTSHSFTTTKRKAKAKRIDFPFLLQQRLFLTSSPVQLHLLLSTEVAQPNCRGE